MSTHASDGMNPPATIPGSNSKGGKSGLYSLFGKGGVQGVATSPAAGAAGIKLFRVPGSGEDWRFP
jgi:hypothetical protein